MLKCCFPPHIGIPAIVLRGLQSGGRDLAKMRHDCIFQVSVLYLRRLFTFTPNICTKYLCFLLLTLEKHANYFSV